MSQLGSPIADPDDDLAMSDDWSCSSPARHEPSEPATSRGRPILAGAVASLLVGVMLGWLASALTQPSVATITTEQPRMRHEAAALAEEFLRLYLTGDVADDLAALFAGETPEPSGAWIESTTAIAANANGDGLWEVIVAVASLEPADGEFVTAPLAYFAVPIATSGNRAVAAGPPARVPAPPPATPKPASLTSVSVEQADTAAGFLTRYLTGDADAIRYLAATSDVALFPTAPYAEANATAAGADAMGRIVVEVSASTLHGVTHTLEYYVTLIRGEGAWVVRDVGTAA